MIHLERLIETSDGRIIDGDLGPCGAVCYIRSSYGVCSLIVADEAWSSWSQSELPHVRNVRWMSKDRVSLWSLPLKAGSNDAVRAYKKSGSVGVPVGQPRDIVFGQRVYFACYGEEAYLAANDGDLASHLIAAFDESGAFLFGLGGCLKDGRIDGAIDVSLGCITEDDEGIFLLYPSNDLWRVLPNKANVDKISFPIDVRGLSALSAAKDKIFFASASASGFLLGHLDTRSGTVEEDGEISYSHLGIITTDLDSRFRIRGCANGTMLIKTDTRIWRVSLT